MWRHWNPASDKEFEQWEFCHEWSPVPVAVPRLKNKRKTKSPNGCITTKHRYLIPKKTPTHKKKETKHRNKTKHDLAFSGTLRGFLGEKEIRLEGGPMIFIVVQAVDFHFGLLPPEGGVDLAQGPLPTIKRICLNPPVLRFCPEIPHLQNRPKFDTFGESMSFFEGLIQWGQYCWWKESCTSWYRQYPVFLYGFIDNRWLAGFLQQYPSDPKTSINV